MILIRDHESTMQTIGRTIIKALTNSALILSFFPCSKFFWYQSPQVEVLELSVTSTESVVPSAINAFIYIRGNMVRVEWNVGGGLLNK